MAGVEVLKYTPEKMVTVRITSPTKVRGKHLPLDKKIEVSEADAYELFIAGKAEKSSGKE